RERAPVIVFRSIVKTRLLEAGRPRGSRGVVILLALLALAVGGLATAAAAAEQPSAAKPSAAPQDSTERVQVEGFRSARWGMTEAQVKAAIQKDFNIPVDKAQVEENPSERTSVPSV